SELISFSLQRISNSMFCFAFFSAAPASTKFYTLSLHDALPIWSTSGGGGCRGRARRRAAGCPTDTRWAVRRRSRRGLPPRISRRSEEHTSELQSPYDLVCRLLLEKKNTILRTLYLRSISNS